MGYSIACGCTCNIRPLAVGHMVEPGVSVAGVGALGFEEKTRGVWGDRGSRVEEILTH
jgi:hypothetical protein